MRSELELREEFKGAKVVIAGNGPTAIRTDLSGWAREGWSIWTVSGGWEQHPDSVLGWNMDDIKGPAWRTLPGYEDRLKRMKENSVPVFTSGVYEDIPCLVGYPLKEIIERFGMKRPYFGETVNYAIAWAILAQVKSLHFIGVDYMRSRPEERASAEFWAGVAFANAIELSTDNRSHFLRTQGVDHRNRFVPDLYGYLPGKEGVEVKYLPNGTVEIG